jgi:hypothetical protein
MRKMIIATLILLAATVVITVIYFKNLNTPAAHATKVMQSIPNNAGLIFEFSNDNGFYDIFSGNRLLTELVGAEKTKELLALRDELLNDRLLQNFFTSQHIYVSVHGQQRDSIDLLLTIAGSEIFNITHMDELAKKSKTGMVISHITLGGKEAYHIYFNTLKKGFYLVNRGNHILSGSFSKDLAVLSAQYKPAKDDKDFLQIPDQQNTNSLANLYINYAQLTPLFDQFFIAKNTSLLKSLRMLPALGALTLNYKTDALMFNGFTNIQRNKAANYLTLFSNQQPVEGRLKDIFPSTTALSTCFGLSDTKKFAADLNRYHANANVDAEKAELFSRIKKETGIQLNKEFYNLLTGEFAMIITRYDEKLGIIALKDGSTMRPLMVNISTMANDDVGQFKYNKLPFYLLGDAFGILNHPYFMILDNYLILATSINELDSYKDSYLNHKFLNKTTGYTDFDNLLAERSNVAYFLHFRNVFPILKREMKPSFARLFNTENNGPNKYYALSWQLSASDRNFYTNFYMRLNKTDTIANQ